MDEILKMLASGAGTAGVILAYQLLVTAKRLLKIEEAIDRSTRTDLLRLVSSPHVEPEVKEAAAAILKEVDEASKARQPKNV